MAKIIYNLRRARKMKGLSIQEAADGLGFSKQYLSKIEIEGIELDSSGLLRFAKFYGVKVDYLLPNKDRPEIELGEIRWFTHKHNH